MIFKELIKVLNKHSQIIVRNNVQDEDEHLIWMDVEDIKNTEYDDWEVLSVDYSSEYDAFIIVLIYKVEDTKAEIKIIETVGYHELYDGRQFQAVEIKTYCNHYWLIVEGTHISSKIPNDKVKVIK